MIPNKGKPFMEELSWKEILEITKTVKMVIMPVGSCEQHGPNLPLDVDTFDCNDTAKRNSA